MITEEKQLLLVDLCARLPYGVIVSGMFHYDICISEHICEPLNAKMLNIRELDKPRSSYDYDWYSDIRPYLRPIDSMLEEEKEIYRCLSVTRSEKDLVIPSPLAMQWLLSRHFDINHLIEKELALIAPKGMYNI